MKYQTFILFGLMVGLIAGCGSTGSNSTSAQSNITVPEAYQVMADFDIISQYDANQMAKSGKMALAQNINNFNTSVAGQLTNNGSMFIGYGIAQLFGGGVSLMDFFNPSLAFRNTAHENKLKKPYLFIAVDNQCNEECGQQKLLDITYSIAKYTAENYARHLDSLELREYSPIKVSKAKQVDFDHHFKKRSGFSGVVSKSYDATYSNIEGPYADQINMLSVIAVQDADFFTINGKRYYGSKISTSEGFRIFLRMLGWPETKIRDNSMVLGMVKASEEHDFIYIETIRGFVKNAAGEYDAGDGAQNRAIGDFMIKDGKYTQLGIYPHPDNQLQGLDEMNYLDVKIGHALDDLVEEVLAEEEASSKEAPMTPSSETE